MNHIPTEVVSAIGERLDGQSLVTCLQVSWDWHHNFLPLVWGKISKTDWIYHSFPLTTWTPLSNNLPHTDSRAQFNARVHRYLQHVRSLTWHNNNALLRDKVFTCLSSQMHLRQFNTILQRTPNLTSFSLVMATQGIEDYILLWILQLLQRLEHLTALEVDIPRQGSVTPIEQHFPLFAKLEALKIAGDWYSEGMIGTLDTAVAMIDCAPAWKVRRLEIDRIDISFFRYCPELEQLTLNTPSCGYKVPEGSAVKEVIVRQLQGLTSLKTMTVYKSFGWKEYVRKIAKLEGSEMMWTRAALYPGHRERQDTFTLRDVFGLSQP
ncbi:hypothetical protein BKA57DRAFT_445843 [Linnemannia elongata]|nr:hypothetical protein BGZ88_007872 [Linnemannia elongata]KAH7059850.1 hypothetical protein BKA57DRAFT_445843 [Linnemannia elongata]